MPETGSFLGHAFKQGLDDGHLVVVAGGVHPTVAVFQLVALVDEQGGVATVVHDQLRSHVAGVGERGRVNSQYSSSVSPLWAKTGTPASAMAAAA